MASSCYSLPSSVHELTIVAVQRINSQTESNEMNQNNPYVFGDISASSQQPAAPLMKPTSVTVFGILHLIFGAFSLCGIGFSLLIFVVPDLFQQPGMAQNPALDLMNNNDGYRVFLAVSLVVGLVATVILLIAGLGLLNGKPFGRRLSIVYGWYGVVSTVAGCAANFYWSFGPTLEMIQNLPEGPEKFGATFGLVAGLIGSALGLVYPVLLLVFMNRTIVIDYFRERAELH